MAKFTLEKGDFFESSRKKERLEYLLEIKFNSLKEIEDSLPKGCCIIETSVCELRSGALPQGYLMKIAVIKESGDE